MGEGTAAVEGKVIETVMMVTMVMVLLIAGLRVGSFDGV